MRQWKKQITRYSCGQVAISVIASISIEEAIKVVGKKGCTKTKDLVKALRALGYGCPDRCRRMERPSLGIGQLRKPNRSGWHWIVVDGNKTFDGSFGQENGTVIWPPECKVVSYLPITEKI